MTEQNRQQIISMRQRGATFTEIGDALGIASATAKTYCWRHNIVPIGPKEATKPVHPINCLNCGKRLKQEPKKKPLKFCSVRCRNTWWNSNRASMDSRVKVHLFCAHCGKEFSKYPSSKQRFCCHQCYINHRFGEVPAK